MLLLKDGLGCKASLSAIAGSDSKGQSPALWFLLKQHQFLFVTMAIHTCTQGPVPKADYVSRNSFLAPRNRPVIQPRPWNLAWSPHPVSKYDGHRVEVMPPRMTPHQDSPRLSAPLGMITSAYFFVCGERNSQCIKEETNWFSPLLRGRLKRVSLPTTDPSWWQLEAANTVFFSSFI